MGVRLHGPGGSTAALGVRIVTLVEVHGCTVLHT
jgi:hypothetical protein